MRKLNGVVLISFLILVGPLAVAGCGGSSPTSSTGGASSADQSPASTTETAASSAAGDNSVDCDLHYIEGKTGDEVAESLSSLYDCLIQQDGAQSEAEFKQVMEYVLGPNEFAAREFTNASTIITLWHTLRERLYEENPGANDRYEVSCADLGEIPLEPFGPNPEMEVAETLTTEGYEESAFNGEETTYNRYLLVPTTPQEAGFGAGNQQIWTLLQHEVVGETPGTYPTPDSCQETIPWNGPIDSREITLH